MATEAGDVYVRVRTDLNDFDRGMRSLDSGLGRAGRAMRTFGKVALVAGAAVTGGFLVGLRRGIDELAESQKVAAQTGAALKSTGASAWTSAKQIEQYAGSLSRMSGIDDEVIQSGQNLLLTFKAIQNQVGKGNDIFDQATRAALDMSVAFKQDISSSAIQLGKALEDPVRGVTALRRVGISFTEAQQDQIKALVKTGDVLAAQKLILAEVNKQVEGSAKAYGETFPGQLAKLRNSFDENMGQIAGQIVPHLVNALEGVGDFFDRLSDAKGFRAKLNVVWDGIQSVATSAFEGVKAALSAIDWSAVWSGIKLNAAALSTRVKTALSEANWSGIGYAIGNAIVEAVKFADDLGKKITMELVSGIGKIKWTDLAAAMARGAWDALGKSTGDKLLKALDIATLPLTPTKKLWQKVGSELGGGIGDAAEAELRRGAARAAGALEEGGAKLKTAGAAAGKDAVAGLTKGGSGMYGAGVGVGERAGRGLVDGLAAKKEEVAAAAAEIVAVAKRAFQIWDSPPEAFGAKIGRRLMEGMGHQIVASGGNVAAAAATSIGQITARMKSAAAEMSAIQRRREHEDLAAAVAAAQRELDLARKAKVDQEFTAKDKARAITEAERSLHRAKEDIQVRAWERELDAARRQNDKMVALAERRKERELAALDAVASKALSAFDKATGGYKSPAEKQLEEIKLRRQQEDLTLAVADAERRLNEARTSGSPEEIEAAERSLARAREDVTVTSLETVAAAERKSWEDRREAQRSNLEKFITNQREQLEKGKTTLASANAAISTRLKSQTPAFAKAGATVGAAFVEGLREALLGAASASGDIGPLIRRVAESIKIPELAAGGIAKARPGGTIVRVGEGRYDEAIVPLRPGTGTGGGGVTVYLTVHGSVQTERDLVSAVIDGIGEAAQRGGAVFSRRPGFAV